MAQDSNTPFFFEGESVTWPVAGVEVVTVDARMSTGSVGVMGLMAITVLTDSGFTGVTVVTGVRGSGLTIAGKDTSSSFPVSLSFCMASELRMTRKWVLSDGVMVTVLIGSGFSFLGTWMLGSRRGLERSQPTARTSEETSTCPGCFRKLPPGPLHVGLGSEQTLRGSDDQLRVTFWGKGLRQTVAEGKKKKHMRQWGKRWFSIICSALWQYMPVIFRPLPIRQRIAIQVVPDSRQFWIHVSYCGYRRWPESK